MNRREYVKEWQKNHPESMKEYYRRQYQKRRQSGKELFKHLKQNAERRGLVCELDINTWQQLRDKECYYCGVDGPNGIDRVDNRRGYEFDNVMPCCKTCNWMKGTQTLDEFFAKITSIYKKHQ